MVDTTELRVARARKDLSMREVAERVGMAKMSYWRKENGQRAFSIDEALKVSEVLELDLNKIDKIFFSGKLKEVGKWKN